MAKDDYDYYDKEEIDKFIEYADKAENLLKTEGYAKRNDFVGMGDYYYDRDAEYGGEFRFISCTRRPIEFTATYDFDSSRTLFEIEPKTSDTQKSKIVSPEEWLKLISESVQLKNSEDQQRLERKAKYLSQQERAREAASLPAVEEKQEVRFHRGR